MGIAGLATGPIHTRTTVEEVDRALEKSVNYRETAIVMQPGQEDR
jgi:hypothetical protein